MLFLNRSKNAIALALLIILMPAQTQAWSFNALWNTVKENAWIATGVLAVAAIFLYNDYNNWKKAQLKKDRPSTLQKPTSTQSNVKKPSPARTASKLQHTYHGYTMHGNLPAESTHTTQAKSSINTIMVTGVATPAHPISKSAPLKITMEIVTKLETELKMLIAQRKLLSEEIFEARRFTLGAQFFNLTLRYNGIQQKFNDRFSLKKLSEVLRENNLPSSLYIFIACTPATSLTAIQAKINAMKKSPLKEVLRRMFSCSYAKENYDAFLSGPSEIAKLEITDKTISGNITKLFHEAERYKIAAPASAHLEYTPRQQADTDILNVD
jgi:hypothetical protein